MTDPEWGEHKPFFEGGNFELTEKETKYFNEMIPPIPVDSRRKTFISPTEVFKALPGPEADYNVETAEKRNQQIASLVLWSRDAAIDNAPRTNASRPRGRGRGRN